MTLSYYPRPGEIVVCSYDQTTIAPEMCKARPAVVVGPRLRQRGRLVTVVPLSTSVPASIEAYHTQIELDVPLPPPFDAPVMWAKCDMVGTVSIDRLDRFKMPRDRRGGARQWCTGRVNNDHLRALKVAVLCGLGFEYLTNHV